MIKQICCKVFYYSHGHVLKCSQQCNSWLSICWCSIYYQYDKKITSWSSALLTRNTLYSHLPMWLVMSSCCVTGLFNIKGNIHQMLPVKKLLTQHFQGHDSHNWYLTAVHQCSQGVYKHSWWNTNREKVVLTASKIWAITAFPNLDMKKHSL